MRFYDIDGVEIDVQDISFFVNAKELLECRQAIDDILEIIYSE